MAGNIYADSILDERCVACGVSTPLKDWIRVFRGAGAQFYIVCPNCGTVRMWSVRLEEQRRLRAERLAKAAAIGTAQPGGR